MYKDVVTVSPLVQFPFQIIGDQALGDVSVRCCRTVCGSRYRYDDALNTRTPQ